MRREALVAAASAEDRPATSVLAEGLAGRLAQRGSKPLGVIDVRQPQQLYTRAAGWFGQRLPLLNQLLTRYHDGGEQRTGAGNFVYRAIPSFPPETPTAFALENSFFPAAGITRPIPIQSVTAAGNDRSLPAAAVLSAAAVSSPSAAPPQLTPSTIARRAALRPSPGSHLGRVGIAHLAAATPTMPVAGAQDGRQWPAGASRPAVAVTGTDTGSPGAATAIVAQFADLTLSAAERGESSATPAVTLRVRRQAPPLADAVSAPTGKPLTETTAAEHTSPAARIPNQPVAPSPLPSGEAMESRLAVSGARPAATLPLATGVQTPLPIRPRSMARQPAGNSVATVFRDRAIATRPLPGDNLLPAAAPSPTRSPVRDAAPAGDRPIAGAGRLPELRPTTVGLEPVIARKAIGAVSSVSGARVDATATAGALDPTRAGLPDRMPFARRTSALQLPESITGTADKPALPVIPEKQMFSAADPVPGLVWRKNIAASTTAGAGNPGMIDAARAVAVAAYPADGGMVSTVPPIMRAESTNLSADNQPGASSPASMPARATALDWEPLLAQLSRRLLRQLTIERERRGGKGW